MSHPAALPVEQVACALLLLLAAVLAGCAGLRGREPPTLDQVVQMSRDGVPAEKIIRELQETNAVYPLTGAQIAKLHDEGVPESVLDYLQQAYVDSVRWQERMRYSDPFWSGCFGCYYYRPWIGPSVVIPY